MKRLFTHSVVMMLALASGVACSKRSVSSEQGESHIDFYVYDIADADFTSRATPLLDASKLTEFKVYAYTQSGFTYIDNLSAKYDATNFTWGFTPNRYWPSESLNFICYSPVSSDQNGMVVESEANNDLTIQYTAPVDVTLQPDILTAAPVEAVEDDGEVDIKFAHKLSGIALKVTGDTTIELTDVTIAGVNNSSTLSLQSDGTYKWAVPTISESGLSYAMGLKDNAVPESATEYNVVTAGDGYLMMLPQTLPASSTITIKVKNSLNETNEIVYSLVNDVDTDVEWVEGKIYMYSLLFEEQGEKIEFTNITVIPWNEYVLEGNMVGGEAEPPGSEDSGVLILPSQISVSGWTSNESTDLN